MPGPAAKSVVDGWNMRSENIFICRLVLIAALLGRLPLGAQNLAGTKAIAAAGNTSYALLSDGTVWVWGQTSVWDAAVGGGQPVPARWGDLTDVVAVSPPFALRVDGTVWAYSFDAAYPSTPVRVNGLSGVVAVAGGWASLALKGDGTVWERKGTALAPVSGLTDIVGIARLSSHSLAVKRDGTVWEWGGNGAGDGLRYAASATAAPDGSTPAQVSGLEGVIAVAAGYGHSLALKGDGTVWAWGFNGSGQLGDGTTEARRAPIQVGGVRGVVKIAAGNAHSVVLTGAGDVWAWGCNAGGQLGDGTTTDRSSPVRVAEVTGATDVAAGRFHTLALASDGTVWAWGADQFGQLGDGAPVPFWWQMAAGPPRQVRALTGITKIAAGARHSLALKNDGTLWAWGSNTAGELGDGQIRGDDWPASSIPVEVSGLAEVAGIAGGDGRSLAVTRGGDVCAWGTKAGMGYRPAPVKVEGISGVASVTGGVSAERIFSVDSNCYSEVYRHMAVRDDGSVWEWAVDSLLSPDICAVGSIPAGPAAIAGLTGVRMTVASPRQNLALKRDGMVWEWGLRGPDPLWQGWPASRPTPSLVSGLADIVAVAAATTEGASYHSLALNREGIVWAWGDNFWGQLGDGTTTRRTAPVQVAGIDQIVAIATRGGDMFLGYGHSVVLKVDGTVWEWPVWQSGTAQSLTPVRVAGLSDIVEIAEGGGHTLALRSDGTVWSWGQNLSGQLGVRTIAIRTTPVQVTAPR